ncbi:MAG: hypothetical protein AABY32_03555 [Nanoarchaeota archaeon]
MDNKIKIGIVNENSNKKMEIEEISYFINNKLNYKHSIYIEDYDLLKKGFGVEADLKMIENLEYNNTPAIADWKKRFILFGNLFFENNRTLINKQAIFLHEIGHIVNTRKNLIINNHYSNLVNNIYNEYLADKFLFDLSKEIFKDGRVEEDLKMIPEKNRKNNKSIFLDLGRLYYYNNFLDLEIVSDKIRILKESISEHKFILDKLKVLCNRFNSERFEDMTKEFIEIEEEIESVV